MGEKVYLKRLSEGSTVDCDPNIDDVVEAIIKEYHMYDVGISDILASISINGLSVEDVVTVYARVYEIIEEDKVYRVADNEKILLSQ